MERKLFLGGASLHQFVAAMDSCKKMTEIFHCACAARMYLARLVLFAGNLRNRLDCDRLKSDNIWQGRNESYGFSHKYESGPRNEPF